MKVLEELIHHICKNVAGNCGRELKLLKHKIEVPETPFKRFTYNEVLEELRRKKFTFRGERTFPLQPSELSESFIPTTIS